MIMYNILKGWQLKNPPFAGRFAIDSAKRTTPTHWLSFSWWTV